MRRRAGPFREANHLQVEAQLAKKQLKELGLRNDVHWRSRLQNLVHFTYLDVMNDASPLDVLNDLLDPLSRCLDAESARRVAEFRIDPAVEEKIRLLAERANEGLLNENERADYDAIINTADIISILKLKTERHLKSNGS